MNLTPSQTIRALRHLFPQAKTGVEIAVFSRRSEVQKIVSPRSVTEAELQAAFEASPDPAPQGREITKLTVRRRLRALGKEDAFDAALNAIPHARADYDDAQTLNTSDPIFTTASPLLKTALAITDEQFDALLAP